MNPRIKKIVSSIPVAQKSALNALINKRVARGETTSRREILGLLNDLQIKFNKSNQPVPILDSYRLQYTVNSFNLDNLIDYTSLDLGVAYTELDTINELFESLQRINTIDQDVIIKAVTELDDALTLVEILDDQAQDQYTVSHFNTFRGDSSSSLSFNSPYAPTLYTDPNIHGKRFTYTDVVSIGVSAEGAMLPVTNTNRTPIVSAYLSRGINTTETDYNLNSLDTPLSPIPQNYVSNIREDDASLWAHYIYKDRSLLDKAPATVYAELILDLGGLTSINMLKLISATPAPLTVNAVLYEGADGNIYTITNTPFIVTADTSITYARVTASKVYLQLSQSNFQTFASYYKHDELNAYADIPQPLGPQSNTPGAVGIKELSGTPVQVTKELDGWLYTFAINQIVLGLSSYASEGIFASKIITTHSPVKKVALDVSQTNSYDASSNPAESIEYTLYRFDYDSNDSLINTLQLPIMPLNTSSITHEHLSLNHSGIGSTRFFPDAVAPLVYRDYTLLTIGADYSISVDNGTTPFEDVWPYTKGTVGTPYKMLIKINSLHSTSVYSVTYTPKFEELSTSFPMFMDSAQTVILRSDGAYSISYPAINTNSISYSKLGVVCIIRSFNHQSAFRSSPIIFDYTLFAR